MNQVAIPLTAIVKPTKDCNLCCKYCYEGSATNQKMDRATTEATISEVIGYNEVVRRKNNLEEITTEFLWHGGEPLLMGLDFYKGVKQIQEAVLAKHQSHRVKNGIQSNLTLLTPEMWSFFRENSFILGSSLDGNRESHDSTRPYKNGKSSFEDVIRGLNLTKSDSSSTHSIGTVVVLTKERLSKVQEIYRFFKSKRINFDLGQVTILGRARENREELAVSPNEWGTAMIELFDLWFYDREEPFIEVPELVNYAVGLIKNKVTGCSFSGNCRQAYISVNPNGDVYPCGRFGSDDKFKLGNINQDSLEGIMDSDLQHHLASRNVDNIEDCKVCDYKNLCNGGCFYNAFVETGDPFQKDPFCEGYKMIYRHIEKALRVRLAEKLSELERGKELSKQDITVV